MAENSYLKLENKIKQLLESELKLRKELLIARSANDELLQRINKLVYSIQSIVDHPYDYDEITEAAKLIGEIE